MFLLSSKGCLILTLENNNLLHLECLTAVTIFGGGSTQPTFDEVGSSELPLRDRFTMSAFLWSRTYPIYVSRDPVSKLEAKDAAYPTSDKVTGRIILSFVV